MPCVVFIWTDEIVQHLAEHGISPDEFDEVVLDPVFETKSRSSGLPAVYGWTSTRRMLLCVHQPLNDLQIEPVTAR
jgi:hypothetical protein